LLPGDGGLSVTSRPATLTTTKTAARLAVTPIPILSQAIKLGLPHATPRNGAQL
jgi:hypothetical protein